MIYNDDNLSFKILTVGCFHHKQGVFEVNARPYAALSFRVSGTGDFEIGKKRFITNPGDVLFLPADTPYKVQYSISESIVIHLGYCSYTEPENICLIHPSQIGRQFRALFEAWKQRHSVNYAKSVIYSILDDMANDQKTPIVDTLIANCVQYMEQNFCDSKMDIASLCEYAFISASSLQRGFAKYVGLSPKQYLTQLRMNRALELLSKGELSVREICFECGFTDEKYFSRAFKKKYGYPPSQLKKNMLV